MKRVKKSRFRPAFIRKLRMGLDTRILMIEILFIALIAGAVGRAFQFQILETDMWRLKAKGRQKMEELGMSRRGPILDRNGMPLALSQDMESVYIDTNLVTDWDKTVNQLGQVLDMPPEEIRRLVVGQQGWVWIKKYISEEEGARLTQTIHDNKLAGIGRRPTIRRRYPSNELAAHLIGYTGPSNNGLSGIESHFEEVLSGSNGKMVGMKDALGRKFFPQGIHYRDKEEGGTVRLTINATIQHFVETALDEGWRKAGAKRAMALVMDPMSGELLAIAERPTFNLNAPLDYPQEHRVCHTITTAIEPGSTMKPFIVAAALENGVVTPQTMIDCTSGALMVGNHVIHDTHGHGTIPLPAVIYQSSNIGAFKVADMMGPEEVHRWLLMYGFGQKTGFNFAKEALGLLSPASTWGRITFANIAFGQGVSVSPLQLITAFSALVNGGVLLRPHVVAEVRDGDGQLLERSSPQFVRQVVSRSTSRTITEIMTHVTQEGGTGTRAALPDYRVAAKTGTSQKPYPDRRGYSPEARIGSFIGAVPAEAPRITILVIMDEPAGPMGNKYGGVCAAPVFKQIAERTMRYLNLTDRERVMSAGNVIKVAVPTDGKKTARAAGGSEAQLAAVDGSPYMGRLSRIAAWVRGHHPIESSDLRDDKGASAGDRL